MEYQFRPYAKMQPIEVALTGKVYEKGEHPIYTEHKIIEVVDKEGEVHYAFEDELKSDEVKQQERSYSEEDMKDYALKCISNYLFGEDFISYNLRIPIVENNDKQFEQFKKK